MALLPEYTLLFELTCFKGLGLSCLALSRVVPAVLFYLGYNALLLRFRWSYCASVVTGTLILHMLQEGWFFHGGVHFPPLVAAMMYVFDYFWGFMTGLVMGLPFELAHRHRTRRRLRLAQA